MKSAEIYYFSGTGNSLFIANQLKDRIPNVKLIPIAGLLNRILNKDTWESRNNFPFYASAEIVGFVFPCHGLTIPIPVWKFLKKFNLKASTYLFAVATRGGSVFRGFAKINKILKKQGKNLDASFVIDMCMNDPKLSAFAVPTSEELSSIKENSLKKVNIILKTILNREKYEDNIDGVTFTKYKSLNYVLERMVAFAVHHIAPREKTYFYADSKCTGCGICEKVCLAQKIRMENNQPCWQPTKDCYFCYSCLNYCPNQAIQIYSKFYMKSYTVERGRYPHPYAKVNDIANQKQVYS